MEIVQLNRTGFVSQVEAKCARITNERHRQMLSVYMEHTMAEIDGDLGRVMATMNDEPRFHIWIRGQDIGPKGHEQVEAMYKRMFSTRTNFMEIDLQRVIVDDEGAVVEFGQRKIMPGTNLVSGPMAETLLARGEKPDASAHYLTKGRAVVFLPFNDRGQMLGEDSFTSGETAIRKLADDELPADYLAWS
jgi:hypothetical protein